MPNSVIKITFASIPDVNDSINVKCHLKTPPYIEYSRGETFKAARVNPGETTIEATVNEQATTYAETFALDYNGINDFEISVTDNVVTISCLPNGSFDYFTDVVMVGDFATVEFITPSILVTGLGGDRYLINNEIWMDVTANVNAGAFTIVVQNMSIPSNTGTLSVYPSPTGLTRINLSPIIKSLFAYPSDADGYVIDDQIVPNAANFKITVSANLLDPVETIRTFIRGGNRTNNTNQTLPSNAILRPTVMMPIWQGYETAEYYLDNDNAERKRLLVSINDNVKDFRRTPRSCNLIYVKFLNQRGGYSNWLFESHNTTEANTNLGSFVRNNMIDDLGNESNSKMKAIGKVPEYYRAMINDLIVSPEIYALIDGEYVRVLSGKNSVVFDKVKRAYNVSIDLDFEYRFNPSLLWSN